LRCNVIFVVVGDCIVESWLIRCVNGTCCLLVSFWQLAAFHSCTCVMACLCHCVCG